MRRAALTILFRVIVKTSTWIVIEIGLLFSRGVVRKMLYVVKALESFDGQRGARFTAERALMSNWRVVCVETSNWQWLPKKATYLFQGAKCVHPSFFRICLLEKNACLTTIDFLTRMEVCKDANRWIRDFLRFAVRLFQTPLYKNQWCLELV